jgi:hypothetical protein
MVILVVDDNCAVDSPFFEVKIVYTDDFEGFCIGG